MPEKNESQIDKFNRRKEAANKNKSVGKDNEDAALAAAAAEELYVRAVNSVIGGKVVIDGQIVSIELLKKELAISDSKARSLLEKMEKGGIISAPSEDILQKRTVLVKKQEDNMVDNVQDEVVEPVVGDDEDKFVGLQIDDEEFWKSQAAEGLDKNTYLTDKDAYAKVKDAYDRYLKIQQSGEEEKAADEALEKTNVLEISDASDDQPVINDDENSDWVERYDAFLKEKASENGKSWSRVESPKGTLKGSMDDLDLDYAAKNKMSFQMKEGKAPTAESFKEVVALAKSEDQDLSIAGVTKPASRQAIIEAAAKGGVGVEGLTEEEQVFYDSFMTKEEKTEEKTSFLPERIANMHLRKFDRLACNPDFQVEFEAVLARYEATGVKIGGDDKESEIYTLASYVKAFRAAEKSPENEALAADEKALETVLSKYGVELKKQASNEGVELGSVASCGEYDVTKVAAAIEHIGDRSLSDFDKKDKYKSSPDAEKVMARRGGLSDAEQIAGRIARGRSN